MKRIVDIDDVMFKHPDKFACDVLATAIEESIPYKEGEWIEKVESRGFFAGDKTVYSYTCPFCGVKEFQKYPFCHCGADMRKGDNNDR